jgi:hypothetical protein
MEEKQEQVNNNSRVHQLTLMIVSAKIEQLLLQISYRQTSDEDCFFLYYNE